jgi:hypothetical protein
MVNLYLLLRLNLLLLHFFSLNESSDFLIIEVFKLLLVDFTKLLVSLQQQIVRCSHMVVLIGIDTLDSLVLAEVILHQQIKDLVVDGNLRKTYEDTTCDLRNLYLIEPSMLSYIAYLKSLLRVSIQNLFNEVSAVL